MPEDQTKVNSNDDAAPDFSVPQELGYEPDSPFATEMARKGRYNANPADVPDVFEYYNEAYQMAVSANKPFTIDQLCNVWAWVTATERFINRKDPRKQWKPSQFDSEFNYMADKIASLSKALFKGKWQLRRFPYVEFRPGGYETRGEFYNLWRPSGIEPAEGDTTLWDNHLEWLIPDQVQRDYFLDWLAFVVQNPTKMPAYAALLVGQTFGTGKSIIARVMEHIIGPTNTQRPKNSSLKGEFNSWLAMCRLCIIEELYQIGQREVANALKDLITEPRIEINPKFINAYTTDSHLAMLGISNHPDALPIPPGDRRWMVIESPVTPEEKDAKVAAGYFGPLIAMVDRDNPDRAALAAIAYKLSKRDIKGFRVGGAPMTEAKRTMETLSLTPIERWLTENAGNDPLSRSYVNIQGDVVPTIDAPTRHETKNAAKAVEKFIAAKLDGVAIGDHRIEPGRTGRTAKLWAINDAGRWIKTGGKLADGRWKRLPKAADVVATYRRQAKLTEIKNATGAPADFDDAPDFGEPMRPTIN